MTIAPEQPPPIYNTGTLDVLIFEDQAIGVMVGRLDASQGPELEGAKVLGLRNHTGAHFQVINDATIDELIERLHKLRRSPGCEADRQETRTP